LACIRKSGRERSNVTDDDTPIQQGDVLEGEPCSGCESDALPVYALDYNTDVLICVNCARQALDTLGRVSILPDDN
jgi:hypothetical protein